MDCDRRALLGVAIGALVLAPDAGAQHRIWFAADDVPSELFSVATDVLPDVDGDGVPEVLVGAPGRTCAAFQDGSVSIFSTTAGELQRWCGIGQEALGESLAVMPDLDGDGIA